MEILTDACMFVSPPYILCQNDLTYQTILPRSNESVWFSGAKYRGAKQGR